MRFLGRLIFYIFILLIVVGMTWVEIPSMWYPYIGGYLFAVIFAHFPISLVVRKLHDIREKKYPTDIKIPISERWQIKIIGYLERLLYVASLQLERPEFIAIWLGLRLAGQWRQTTLYKEKTNKKEQEEKKKKDLLNSLNVYNVFLIGNALSIIYAGAGERYIEWCLQCEGLLAIIVLIILSLATFSLLVFLYCREKIELTEQLKIPTRKKVNHSIQS